MFKIAWRSIMRNKRRSLLSLGLIIVSIAVLFLLKGYFTSTFEGLQMMAIREYSNLQIAKEGFWDKKSVDRKVLSKDDIAKINEILNNKEHVTDYTRTLQVSGILGTEKRSTIVSAMGVETDYKQNISIKSGTSLFPGDQDRVIVGQGIKKILNIEEDEWVSIMATTIDGAYNAGSLQLSGSFSIGNDDADSHYIMMPLSFAQILLNTEGVDKFKVLLTDTKLTDRTIVELKSDFKEAGLDVEMRSWEDLAAFYHQVRGLYETAFLFLSMLIFLLIFISILEIMSMSFFERMNEIGTVRAIGTRQSQVFTQLIQEALIIGVMGGVLGIALGWIAGNIVNSLNITYTPPNTQEVPLYIKLALKNGITPFLIVILATTLSTVYPALKAARLKVVEMLRHV
ncbi:FtsX-like permease family protein [Iocasia frigidifontis]|uniref:FtsX-like permease family protein n=1 Tax=Iocasia fonsfrigidae TaxID=2682810 RepID=A0A8A7KC85_9FIRM|nr:FtsX-like permease family protein [Iocasia fonsfrigidae]QTL99406.1 FtsX-like permease family protein [Iocasia fonsfrigidae]